MKKCRSMQSRLTRFDPSRKDPSREAHKFTDLENLVPILFHDSFLWARSAFQIHNCRLYL